MPTPRALRNLLTLRIHPSQGAWDMARGTLTPPRPAQISQHRLVTLLLAKNVRQPAEAWFEQRGGLGHKNPTKLPGSGRWGAGEEWGPSGPSILISLLDSLKHLQGRMSLAVPWLGLCVLTAWSWVQSLVRKLRSRKPCGLAGVWGK